MKKRISISLPLFLLIVVALFFSLFGNIIQFDKFSTKPLQLTGSYCTNAHTNNGIYLVFDKEGYYYKYDQTNGLLEEGTYMEYATYQYLLKGKSGESGQILLTEDGVYYVPETAHLRSFHNFQMFLHSLEIGQRIGKGSIINLPKQYSGNNKNLIYLTDKHKIIKKT